MPKDRHSEIENVLLASPLLSHILENWNEVALPDAWLVAGSVVQTYWNHAHQFPQTYGIKDVDIIYFDTADSSAATESRHHRRINNLFDGLNFDFDVTNEARVHLWYEQKFGSPIRPYPNVESAIESFPTTAGAIGIRPSSCGIEFYTPYSVDDLINLIVRPNKMQITRDIYDEKVERWKQQWPQLMILDWNDV